MSEKYLLNDLWQFTKQELGTTLQSVQSKDIQWNSIDLPHDWLIYQATNLYKPSEGWYKRTLSKDQLSPSFCYSLRFEGVYMDSSIYINSKLTCEWKYGYSTFEFDITDFLTEPENEILVKVIYQSPNSRWYTGAGIYRNVWLIQYPITHIASDGVYICPKLSNDIWSVFISTELSDHRYDTMPSLAYHPFITETEYNITPPKQYELRQTIYYLETPTVHRTIASIQTPIEFKDSFTQIEQTLELEDVHLWDITSPNLYLLVTELLDHQTVIDTTSTRFGFRQISFDCNQGFFLNGRHVKLQGSCEHHDLGALGSAVNREAIRYRLQLLQEMGVNAIRTAHNMPCVELMELSDEMGILIVSEAFDMWRGSKTPYDYARFFDQWAPYDVASWIRLDRNHPSIILWSIGNEIHDTHQDESGINTTKYLVSLVHQHDFYHTAFTTIGSNYMPWENARKCAEFVDVIGYNYGEKYYIEHHREHPNWCIYGSETSSIVQSRGIYHFPYQQSVLADDDEQCSALGNSATSWGAKNTEFCIITERDTTYRAGQFIWTGFDYIGEPTPYHTKNSYFGQLDTAGFKKDSFYFYQSAWTDYKTAPMIHILPCWDFSNGQLIDIRVCSNAPKIELFFYDTDQSEELLISKLIDHQTGSNFIAHVVLPYQRGTLKALAYDEQGHIIASDTVSSFDDPYEIILTPNKQELLANGEDLVFLEISMIDKNGLPVSNANNRVTVSVTGQGRLLGLDNGDSTDFDEYKGISRRLFSGKLMAIIGSTLTSGTAQISVSSSGLPTKSCTIIVKPSAYTRGISANAINYHNATITDGTIADIPIRKLELVTPNGTHLTKENPTTKVYLRKYPLNTTYSDVAWRLTDSKGIDSTLANLMIYEDHAVITALYNGRVYLRCSCNNGSNNIRLLSQLEFDITDLPDSSLDPYHFISAGLYTLSNLDLTNGNDRGVATARDLESHVGFEQVDFGDYGSDEITVPIFSLDSDPLPLEIWKGMKGEENSELLASVIYQKPTIWNTYQEETFRLNRRVKGRTTICFVVNKKVHIKGFVFKKVERAFQKLYGTDCDSIYGDTFSYHNTSIVSIGNNVTIEFNALDFGLNGVTCISVYGKSLTVCNSIQLRVITENETYQELLVFQYSGTSIEREYTLPHITGITTVQLIFLPGCNFNLDWIQFQ